MFPLRNLVQRASSLRAFCNTQATLCRALSTAPPAVRPQVVPSEILQPLEDIETFLKKKSSISGRVRYDLYTNESKFIFPEHEIEDDIPELTAFFKVKNPKKVAKFVREDGNSPAVIHGFDKDACFYHNLSICIPTKEANAMVRKYGRNGCASRVFKIKVVNYENPEEVFGCIRARPTTLLMTATSLEIELIHFQFLPRNKLCHVRVPLRLTNDDVAPGVKKGGWISVKQRLIDYQCRGDSVPPFIELDARNLQLEDRILKRHLPIPSGTRLLGTDFDSVVLHCTTDVGKD